MSDSPRKKLRVQFSASSLVATRYFSSQDSPVIVRPPQKLPNEAVCSLSTARQKNWNEKSPIDFAVPSPNESCGSKANSPTSQFNFQTETDSKRLPTAKQAALFRQLGSPVSEGSIMQPWNGFYGVFLFYKLYSKCNFEDYFNSALSSFFDRKCFLIFFL